MNFSDRLGGLCLWCNDPHNLRQVYQVTVHHDSEIVGKLVLCSGGPVATFAGDHALCGRLLQRHDCTMKYIMFIEVDALRYAAREHNEINV